MLNLVPIQFLALVAYFILRMVVGFVWLTLARRHFTARAELRDILRLPLVPGRLAVTLIIVTEVVIGMLFIFGAATQVAALLAIVWCFTLFLFRRYFAHPSFPNSMSTLLLATIALALFITGAGVIAVDLPI